MNEDPPQSEARRLLTVLEDDAEQTDPLLDALLSPAEREALAAELAAVEAERARVKAAG